MTKPASGEARNSAGPATSPGSPQRPSGVRARIGAVAGGVLLQRPGQRRAIQPGAMAFTRMPSAA